MKVVRGESFQDIQTHVILVKPDDVGKHFEVKVILEGYTDETRAILTIEEMGPSLAEHGLAVDTPVAEWVKRPLRPGETILERVRGPQPQPLEACALVDAPTRTQPYACERCGGTENNLALYWVSGKGNVLMCRPGYGHGCNK